MEPKNALLNRKRNSGWYEIRDETSTSKRTPQSPTEISGKRTVPFLDFWLNAKHSSSHLDQQGRGENLSSIEQIE